jgi:hypothetical protein
MGEREGSAAITLPFPQRQSFEGHEVIALDSYGALVEEGVRMSHCVASLYRACRSGQRIVFSVRNHFGASLCTFDVSLHGESLEPNECRGGNNSDPPQAMHALVLRFVHDLSVRLTASPEVLKKWQKALADEHSAADFFDDDQIEQQARRLALRQVISRSRHFDQLVSKARPRTTERGPDGD